MRIRKKLLPITTLALSAALLVTAFTPVLAVSQADIDELNEQKEALQAEQEEIKGTIDELEAQQSSVIEQKKALDEQNELARQEIELINEQIDIYDQLVANKSAELEEAEAAEEEQSERYRARVRAMEEEGTVSYLGLLFQASSFSDFLSRLDFVREIMEYDKTLEEEYIAARENVQTVKAEYEETLAEQEATKTELEEKKADLEASIEEATQLIADLEDDIEEYEAYYAEKEAAEAELDAEITEKLQELQKQEEEAKASGGTGIVSTGVYIWPLPGYSAGSRTFGYQLHPILNVMKYHSGQDIGAPTGTPIIAADSGTVAIANTDGYGGGYGNYVTINHGDGRATLYAHMSSVAVTVGQTVSQGDVIGYVGSTGLSTGPHLHFEVRVNGTAVDPMQYFS